MVYKYKLYIRTHIEKITEKGGTLGEKLEVATEFQIDAKDFMEVCGILREFQLLAERIKSRE